MQLLANIVLAVDSLVSSKLALEMVSLAERKLLASMQALQPLPPRGALPRGGGGASR